MHGFEVNYVIALKLASSVEAQAASIPAAPFQPLPVTPGQLDVTMAYCNMGHHPRSILVITLLFV